MQQLGANTYRKGPHTRQDRFIRQATIKTRVVKWPVRLRVLKDSESVRLIECKRKVAQYSNLKDSKWLSTVT